MKTYFDAEFFAGNRQKLKELFGGTAPILITANGLLQRSRDTAFTFRQDSNFWYLTGINEPDAVLVMDRGKEYLIMPTRSDYQELFEGSADEARLSKRSGITDIYFGDWRKLDARLRKVKHIATILPPSGLVENYGIRPNPARQSLVDRSLSVNPKLEILDVGKSLASQRAIKQPPELAAIEAAIKLTASTFNKVAKKSGQREYEWQVAADITSRFAQAGAVHAYQPIVATGVNATILHYTDNQSKLLDDQLLLIDAGAEVENYAADITRTLAPSRPSTRQREVLAAVAQLQDQAFSILKPGISLKQFEEKMTLVAGEKLRELGLIKTINRESVREFYPHATSHFLGLDVHDVGDYEQPLAPGMVITVEPGIYIKEESIGVRIEDDVLITDRGNENLSAKLPQIL